MPDQQLPSKTRAMRIVDAGVRETFEIYDGLQARARTMPGLGGGEWSPKDLIGHLESWEEYAIEAIESWAQGHGPASDRLLWSSSTSAVNRAAVERKSVRRPAEQRRRAEATHEHLLELLAGFGDAAWRRPGTPRGRTPAGRRLGNLLGGPAGLFRHADAHLPQLRTFAQAPRRGN